MTRRLTDRERLQNETDRPGDDSNGLPSGLRDAVASAEMLLKARDGVHQILASTHTSIPQWLRERQSLLAELSHAEVTGGDTARLQARVGEIDLHLDESWRKRRGAIGVLLNDQKVGSSELLKAKDAISEARREYAAQAVAEFQRLLDEEISRVQALWRYGDALAAALGVSIPMPAPARVSTHVIRADEIERDRGPEVAVSLPAPIQKVSEVVSRLDSALGLCQSITRARSFDLRRDKLQSIGSASAMQDTSGVFTVSSPAGILCGLDGLTYAEGTVIDADLIGPGPLQRLIVARAVRRVDTLAMVATPAPSAA